MDYEKKYNEALERANKQRADYQKELDKTDKNSQLAGLLRAGISAIDMAFPELHESEDERIRKEILSYFNSEDIANQYVTEERRKRWTAWLEKQKEQKPVEIHNPTDEEIESWRKELTEFKKFATKQAKENQLHISYTCNVMWENFCSELLSFVNSRKPVEWSEKDKEMLKRCIAVIPVQGDEILTISYLSKLKNWLRELPERFNFQPKQEWSEEDGAKLGALINYFEGDALDYSTDDIVDWLKSLRPSWKPSELQMTALDGCLEHWSGNKYQKEILESLYEQLKKL